ncbi:MAG: hypothetical protein FJZ63_02320 [Chlamydiae bacterium]|nr:hypothetical protein [Chlamydiota bacterium]
MDLDKGVEQKGKAVLKKRIVWTEEKERKLEQLRREKLNSMSWKDIAGEMSREFPTDPFTPEMCARKCSGIKSKKETVEKEEKSREKLRWKKTWIDKLRQLRKENPHSAWKTIADMMNKAFPLNYFSELECEEKFSRVGPETKKNIWTEEKECKLYQIYRDIFDSMGWKGVADEMNQEFQTDYFSDEICKFKFFRMKCKKETIEKEEKDHEKFEWEKAWEEKLMQLLKENPHSTWKTIADMMNKELGMKCFSADRCKDKFHGLGKRGGRKEKQRALKYRIREKDVWDKSQKLVDMKKTGFDELATYEEASVSEDRGGLRLHNVLDDDFFKGGVDLEDAPVELEDLDGWLEDELEELVKRRHSSEYDFQEGAPAKRLAKGKDSVRFSDLLDDEDQALFARALKGYPAPDAFQ